VGDSDEYDDLVSAKFNASLSTPAFSLDGVAADTAILVYDSSWRQEPQSGTVSVSFDGGDPVVLLTLTPDTPTGYNETVTLPLGNPDGANTAVITWDHQGKNNWWWAIDNIKVTVGKAPAGIVTQLTSVEATEGDGVNFTVKANGDEPIFYKWFKGDVEIVGADGPVLELSNVSEEEAGYYSVVVSNSAGSATSNPARLAVLLKSASIPVFEENFDSLELGPFVSTSESNGDGTDWTDTTPTGWVVTKADNHGPTDAAASNVVKEFDGWTFLDPVSWNATAGQDRAQFTKGTGVIAVGDSDEYDDMDSARFNASLSTPPFSLDGVEANSLVVRYDSSWRKEPQTGSVSIAYDGGASVTLLELTSETPTAYNDTVVLYVDNPAGAKQAVITWDHQGKNNWWWAIDNIVVFSSDDPRLAADKATYLSGEDITVNFSNGLGNPKDWVGIYKPDGVPGDVGSTKWLYVSGSTTAGEGLTDGAITFAGGLPAGSYVARFFENDGYTQIADAVAFTVVDPPGVTTNKAKYAPSESITVNFSKGPGNPKDWIGLYRPDMTPGPDGSLKWAYVSGTQTAGEGLTDGSVVLDGLVAGDYVARFFENDGYTQLAETSFKVVDSSVLPEGVFFAEDFDGLALGPWVSDSESGGDGTDWTATPPADWVMALGADHGPTADGDDVVEFDGWTFVDPVSWNTTAGQARAEFTKGTGVIAVGDSDEYDDKVDAKFNASLSTPAIDISGAAAGSLVLTYDSSWRQEPQQGKVTVSYDGGDPVTLLELTPDTPTGYNDTVSLSLNNPAGAQTAVVTWDHQGHNNWWWAIDNIKVAVEDGPEPPPTISIVNNGDGTATVTFEGKLQAAATVNGPWADVEGAVSPQIIPVDQVMQFGRAVK
jgi:hypothetical protein